MNVYKFTNKLDNTVKRWPRFFVAISLCDAKFLAKEWSSTVNEANGNIPEFYFSFDYDNVIIVEEDVEYDEGYIEFNDREI